ncbi:GIY-YIG nuclease family protein [Asticcacaulis taihuensis]|uniref:GIY-YIG catalytic domain-containing protein n=1 Tax=Asticcacaulis taihuensis TaxID=260084 RepID=A0A1G4Q567_9CAUL|nr:GIY-YIG catalytic domain-containing protein [Asticcacaulis taihuensis]
MHYVYLIRSLSSSGQTYVGLTDDLKQRLAKHNSGGSTHTSKYVPWEIVSYHAFADKQRAVDFEKYLKSGSGQAFSRKRFW